MKNNLQAKLIEVSGGEGLVVDGRDMSRDEVRTIACKLLTGKATIEECEGGGFFLVANTLHYYHVGSIRHGIYVVSKTSLTPEQTRIMAKKFLHEIGLTTDVLPEGSAKVNNT